MLVSSKTDSDKKSEAAGVGDSERENELVSMKIDDGRKSSLLLVSILLTKDVSKLNSIVLVSAMNSLREGDSNWTSLVVNNFVGLEKGNNSVELENRISSLLLNSSLILGNGSSSKLVVEN